MKLPALAACLLALLLLGFALPRAHAGGWPGSSDRISPPLPAAKPYIDFDGRGFLVRGRRTFIVAGELQYPRTPRALWRDRLLRIKWAGYNTVQTYAFWNYHEPTEGKFDFSGEKDLDAYLKLVHSLGLYAIVRMGPYVNAEWDSGGLPLWLRFHHPGLRPMTDNKPFYKAVTPYFNRLVPILAANQINHGGPILMVQLENEHTLGGGLGAGTDLPNPYYRWYYAKMRAMGLEVPLFFSGLHHSDDPAGDSPLDTATRTSPWYSTEFWTGWYGVYGVDPDRAKKLERAAWKVIAYGGAGYTHYTLVGGTDFDTWNNNDQAASYDFGAPIGQAGDLRVSYAYCKKAALFATSFPNLLADSVSTDGGDGAAATDGRLQVTHRKGRAGEAVFCITARKTPRSKLKSKSAARVTRLPGQLRWPPARCCRCCETMHSRPASPSRVPPARRGPAWPADDADCLRQSRRACGDALSICGSQRGKRREDDRAERQAPSQFSWERRPDRACPDPQHGNGRPDLVFRRRLGRLRPGLCRGRSHAARRRSADCH